MYKQLRLRQQAMQVRDERQAECYRTFCQPMPLAPLRSPLKQIREWIVGHRWSYPQTFFAPSE